MSSKLLGSGHLTQTSQAQAVPTISIPNEGSLSAHDLTDDLIAELGNLGGDQDKNSVELLNDNLDRDNWNPFETPRSNILKEPMEDDFQQSDVEKSESLKSDQHSFADEREILEKLEFVCQDQVRTKNSTRMDSEGGGDTRTYWEEVSNGTNTVGSESPGREGYLYAGQQTLRSKQLDKLIKYAPAVDLITEEEDTDNSFRFSQVWHDLTARLSKHLLHDVFKTAKEYNIDSQNYKRMGVIVRTREKLIYVLARMRSARKVLLKRFLDILRKLQPSEQTSPIQLKPESIMQAKNAKGRESLKSAAPKNIKLDLQPFAEPKEPTLDKFGPRMQTQPVCFTEWRWRNDPFSSLPRSDAVILNDESKAPTPRPQKLFRLGEDVSRDASLSRDPKHNSKVGAQVGPSRGSHAMKLSEARLSQRVPNLDFSEGQFKLAIANYPSSPSESSACVSVYRQTLLRPSVTIETMPSLRRGLLLLISTSKVAQRRILLTAFRRVSLGNLGNQILSKETSKGQASKKGAPHSRQTSKIATTKTGETQTKLIVQSKEFSKTRTNSTNHKCQVASKVNTQTSINLVAPRKSETKVMMSPAPMPFQYSLSKARQRTSSGSQSPLIGRVKSHDSSISKKPEPRMRKKVIALEIKDPAFYEQEPLVLSRSNVYQNFTPRTCTKYSTTSRPNKGPADSIDDIQAQLRLSGSGLKPSQCKTTYSSSSAFQDSNAPDSQPPTRKHQQTARTSNQNGGSFKIGLRQPTANSNTKQQSSQIFRPQVSKQIITAATKKAQTRKEILVETSSEVSKASPVKAVVACIQMKKSATTGGALLSLTEGNHSAAWLKPKSDSKLPPSSLKATVLVARPKETSNFLLEKPDKKLHKSISSSQKMIDRVQDSNLLGRVKQLKTDLPLKTQEVNSLLKAIGSGKSTSYITEVIHRHNQWMDSIDSDLELHKDTTSLCPY